MYRGGRGREAECIERGTGREAECIEGGRGRDTPILPHASSSLSYDIQWYRLKEYSSVLLAP